jgi:ABC-type Fe3+ transport system permease subunit
MNWVLLKNSLVVSGIAAVLATVFGAVAALWALSLEQRGRRLVIILAIVSLALPPFLVTNSWLDFLGPAGTWRRWLPLDIFSMGGTAWLLALLTWPIPFFAVLAAWQRLEPYQLESDPAITGWVLIRHLLLPLAHPALLQAGLIAFVLALNNFAVPAILQVKVFPAETWVEFNTSFNTIGALKLSWPLIVTPFLILLWLSRYQIAWPRLEGAAQPRAFRRQLGRSWFWSAGLMTLVLFAISACLPLFQLFSTRRTWTELPGALAAGQLAIWNSALFALPSATIAIVVCVLFGTLKSRQRMVQLASPTPHPFPLPLRGEGTTLEGKVFQNADRPANDPLSPHGERERVRGGRSMSVVRSFLAKWGASLLWLPFLTPGVLLGILLIAIFNHSFLAVFYQSAGIVILALLIRYCGPAWTAVSHAFQGSDRDLFDAAELDGASRWQILRHVQWPQLAPQITAIWYVLFLLCLWDVESIVLIVPPGRETMALRIFNLLHYGHNAQVNALCLTLLLMALAPLALYVIWSVVRSGTGARV